MNLQKPRIVEAVISTPLRRSFDYLIPDNQSDSDSPSPGCRLLVPFGKSKRIAMVIGIKSDSELPLNKLKPYLECLDKEPVLDAELLKLTMWASAYYHHSIGDICFKVLPALLRTHYPASLKPVQIWRVIKQPESLDEFKRAPKQLLCIKTLTQHPKGLTLKSLKDRGVSADSVKKLSEKGYIQEHLIAPHPKIISQAEITPPELNFEQKTAIDDISLQDFHIHLLDGVTGSGKTEVYIQTILKILKQNKQVLVLVPEIGLTPQLVRRFEQRLKVPIALLHSNLGDRERLDNWLMSKKGQYPVVVGTRSALFTPMPDLGLIIIDEEHDSSFKQQQGWHYSARDLALIRARDKNIPVILGSATPSLETLNRALNGHYRHLKLRQRPGKVSLPEFQVLDIKKLPLEQGLSRPLLQAMKNHLEAGNQVLIFLNRRGYAPVLMCHDCGWMASCKRCETSYTLHQSPQHLHCHHCNGQRQIPAQCPECNSDNITAVGVGTERLEDCLSNKFADYPLVRIDRDSTRRKDTFKNYVEDINAGEYKILIGTQMLSKGHHFPNVSLVAIIDMDGALFSADFRASEKFAQLLIQVAGRAGRSETKGTVMLQTHHPDHPNLQSLIKDGYEQFAIQTLNDRKECFWPPFSFLAMFRAESPIKQNPEIFLQDIADLARKYKSSDHPVSIMGPVSAPMARRSGRYRYQLLLQATSRQSLQKLLKQLINGLESKKTAKSVRWSLDVDPQEMF